MGIDGELVLEGRQVDEPALTVQGRVRTPAGPVHIDLAFTADDSGDIVAGLTVALPLSAGVVALGESLGVDLSGLPPPSRSGSAGFLPAAGRGPRRGHRPPAGRPETAGGRQGVPRDGAGLRQPPGARTAAARG
jgi:hypothetical protein